LLSVFRWREGAEAARRALRLSPWDLFSAIYDALRPMPHTSNVDYDEAIRLPREGIRQRNDFAGTLRPQPWRVRWISPRPCCKSCAAHSPTFLWPGWRATFPSGEMSVNILWKACAAAASHQ
jgi:hypothetical protein